MASLHGWSHQTIGHVAKRLDQARKRIEILSMRDDDAAMVERKILLRATGALAACHVATGWCVRGLFSLLFSFRAFKQKIGAKNIHSASKLSSAPEGRTYQRSILAVFT